MIILKAAIRAANEARYTYFAEGRLDPDLLGDPFKSSQYPPVWLYPTKLCPNICVSFEEGGGDVVGYGKASPEIQLEFLFFHAAYPYVCASLLRSGAFMVWEKPDWLHTLDRRYSLYDNSVILWGGGVP